MVNGLESLKDINVIFDVFCGKGTRGSPEFDHLFDGLLPGIADDQKFDPIAGGQNQGLLDRTIGSDQSLKAGIAIRQGQLLPDGDLGCPVVESYEIDALIHYGQSSG
jgi:hypothetical protein